VDADPRLRPGSFVQVRLVTVRDFPVVAVPRSAVYTVAGLNKLFVIRGGKAEEVRLEEILGSDGWVELPMGKIDAGLDVAISNLPVLTNGAAVTITGGRS
jgi:multidrug efflux pump subunit AcrA (membrane-fusion protein)